jgi:soluble lytic murein transglycosylase
MRGGAGRRLLAVAVAAALILSGAALLLVVRAAYPLDYEEAIREACSAHRLDPYLVISLISVESRFRPEAVSSVGAVGLMQLMPPTATWVAEENGILGFSSEQLRDPEMNASLGTWYLAHLLDRYAGDEFLALAAYNAGPTAVDRWLAEDGVVPAIVGAYADRVRSGAARYRFWYSTPLLGAVMRAIPR